MIKKKLNGYSITSTVSMLSFAMFFGAHWVYEPLHLADHSITGQKAARSSVRGKSLQKGEANITTKQLPPSHNYIHWTGRPGQQPHFWVSETHWLNGKIHECSRDCQKLPYPGAGGSPSSTEYTLTPQRPVHFTWVRGTLQAQLHSPAVVRKVIIILTVNGSKVLVHYCLQ